MEFQNGLQPKLLERPEPKVQALRLRRERNESTLFIEGAGALVQRIDDDGADDAMDRIKQQGFTEPGSQAAKIDGQSYDDSRGHGIMRQPPGEFCRQIVLLEACGAHGVVAGSPFGWFARCDEDTGAAPPGVLGSLLADLTVERRLPAGEGRAVVMRGERLDCRCR